jgi:cysteinyl-tRNA synthetase
LIQERVAARKNKDFKRADEVRETLSRQGVILQDTPRGTEWRIKNTLTAKGDDR